mmetsp:Transcript_5723/g.22578  ORF Transcript_5723/g.22578 Transcript_5723/m.22578 type:complete len:96 (-) Transcript_5723:1884-2171(-)
MNVSFVRATRRAVSVATSASVSRSSATTCVSLAVVAIARRVGDATVSELARVAVPAVATIEVFAIHRPSARRIGFPREELNALPLQSLLLMLYVL